ncbi:MAG: GxxExxY protein [Bacteroidota bacterium]
MERKRLNEISHSIIGSAIDVHRHMGPGLLESIYEECLAFNLAEKGLIVKRQVKVPLVFKGYQLNKYFFLDLIVEDELVLEVKSVERLLPVHELQLLSYLKLTDKRLGLLINFNVTQLTKGLKRIVNNF